MYPSPLTNNSPSNNAANDYLVLNVNTVVVLTRIKPEFIAKYAKKTSTGDTIKSE